MPPRRRVRERNEEEDREMPPPPQQPPRAIEELFLKQNPPSFDGAGSPVDAELWVRSLERIFNFLRCTTRERLSCVAFQLNGSADFWWEAKRKTMTPEQLENFSWEDFKTGIYEKYIPKSYRRKKEVEFFNLEQGKMTVTEYDRAFCDTSRYAPHLVDTDGKMSEKFCSGLRSEIRMSLAGHGDLTYSDALGRALDIEAAMPEERPVSVPSQHTGDKGKRKWNGNSENNYGSQGDKKPWQGNAAPQGQGQNDGRQFASAQYEEPPRYPTCPKCRKMHSGTCLVGSDICYKCGQRGHTARFCNGQRQGQGDGRMGQPGQTQPPMAIQGNASQYQQQQRPQQNRAMQAPQARAFALQQEQPAENEGNLRGMMMI